MSDIHINRGGQNLGIFTETEVQTGLNSGKYLTTDLAWRGGMDNWKPLAQWSEFTIPANLPPPPIGPVLPGVQSPGGPPALLSEKNLPSWEQRETLGFFNALGLTAKEVLLEPGPTFLRMKEFGGIMTPFLYMLITTGIGVILSFALQIGMQGVFGSVMATQNAEVSRAFAAQGMGIAMSIAVILVILPIAIFVGSFVGSALWHVSLMILGGANKPYEATYRVYCYCKGSTSLVSLVPCCGPIAAMVWNIVSGTIGLSKVHGISTGKAVSAILLPLILCCSICGVGIFFIVQSFQSNPEWMNWMENAAKSRQ